MPPKSNVTLQCQTSTKNVNFVLRKGSTFVESVPSQASTVGLAEFRLTDLKSFNAGQYTCEYYRRERPHITSQPSDILLLLVTGDFPKPSLQAHRRGEATAGDTVTLQCQRPDNNLAPVMFALLKAGAAGPIQVQTPAGKETDFSLRTVTVGDTGNYSCVYFLMKAPFWASHPSDRLAVRVTVFGLCCFAFLENFSGCPSKRASRHHQRPSWASLRAAGPPADGTFTRSRSHSQDTLLPQPPASVAQIQLSSKLICVWRNVASLGATPRFLSVAKQPQVPCRRITPRATSSGWVWLSSLW
ncbi:T-cell-interacting, activating receptor on myeloid cells protein 1-like isoform X2 [Ursus maritimus]|nr:T-cell-interacting, activating receptor on myeloid cells protein 1-like isoform X2 [Ursus maritimus]XP_040489823.1 T-cell-interacting, activating receptor on myeloid cells protein 1-like isoform X2 [Ursus maritimus]